METILASVLAIILAHSLIKNWKKRTALEKMAEFKHKRHLELQTKAQVVSEQASCYPNTLGGEGAKMIAEIQGLIKEQEEIFSQLEYYLNSNKLEQAENVLSSFTLNQTSIKSEKLLSEMSSRIALASNKATETRLPKMRKRNSTIASLKSAGLMEK